MRPHESLWPSSGDTGRGITSGTFSGNLRGYFGAAGLPPSGVHIFRHSAAKLRREAGESVHRSATTIGTACVRGLDPIPNLYPTIISSGRQTRCTGTKR